MKKLILATAAAAALLATSAPSFAEQENQNMDLKEMRRAELFMMKQMVDSNMMYMKSQEEMLKHFSDMLQEMIDCGTRSTKDGAKGCF